MILDEWLERKVVLSLKCDILQCVCGEGVYTAWPHETGSLLYNNRGNIGGTCLAIVSARVGRW